MARLLLIEDDAEIRNLLERFLGKAGFLVTIAPDGAAGLKLFTEAPFDVVLTDGLLPKKNGYELSVAIRAMPKGHDVVIVMITAAFKGASARKDAYEKGIDAFFTKPFILTDLRERLIELLAKHGKKPLPTGAPATTVAKGSASPAPASAVVAKEPARTASSPGSNPGFTTPPKSDASRHTPPPPLLTANVVRAPVDVARALLGCARHRLSGVVELVDEASQLKLAFLRGVVVGASDNLRETLLGERLWKQGKLTTEQMRTLNARMAQEKERVAEALLSLGYCSADDALGYVDEQARSRVRRALLWTGTLKVVEDERAAAAMAVSSLELVDVILAFGLEATQKPEADRLVASQVHKPVERAFDFDSLLLALARVKPDASLPVVVLGGVATAAEAARSSSASELYAAWLAGLIRFGGDPPADKRPLPDVMRSSISASLVDRELVNRVCALLLRARGRSFYEVLDVKSDVSAADALAKVDALERELGDGSRALGPAAPAARELREILSDARRTLSDASFREGYDALIAMSSAPATPAAPKNEDAFLQGQAALEAGDFVRALGCFELAVFSRPGDPDYQSYLGWTQYLTGDASGPKRLQTVTRDHPQAMRPLFFLGLVAAKMGDDARARMLLQECARRAPNDIEIQVALSAFD